MTVFAGLEHCVRQDEPLAAHTWLRVGGPAKFFAEPTNFDDLRQLLQRAAAEGLPVRLLGGGSNVLVRDAGFPGLVVQLSAPAFGQISVKDRRVTAGGGARLGHVISAAVREGLAGLEDLVGIPGSVGGAIHGNAGSHGVDVGQHLVAATVLAHDGELQQRSRADMSFGYRDSSVDELVVLDAQWELEPDDAAEITKRMQKQWIVKKSLQPLADEHVGLIFRNPGGAHAGELIDQAGLKGVHVGGAEVSQRHANFIIAQPGASAADVERLIHVIRERVYENSGIELRTQIEIW